MVVKKEFITTTQYFYMSNPNTYLWLTLFLFTLLLIAGTKLDYGNSMF